MGTTIIDIYMFTMLNLTRSDGDITMRSTPKPLALKKPSIVQRGGDIQSSTNTIRELLRVHQNTPLELLVHWDICYRTDQALVINGVIIPCIISSC